MLRRYHAEQGYPWPAAVGNRETIEAYNVISTSIKTSMDRNGVILWRYAYGVGSAAEWDERLRSLAAS